MSEEYDWQEVPPLEDNVVNGEIEVILLLEHTHKGEKCFPGDVITVTVAQRDWLSSINVI